MALHDHPKGVSTTVWFAVALLALFATKSAAVDACTQTTALSGGTTYSSNGSGGIAGGYNYELWRSGSSGTMTVFGVGAAFKASWNNSGDFLARVGLKWNSNQTYTQLGTVGADYNYTKTGTAGGYSFIGIYGWSTGTLVEYYIVDDWFGGGSPPTGGGSMKGTLSIDGGTYNIYTHQQVNQPSITGSNATFWQFFSVRQTPRQCGHISISEHYKKWASLSMTLGNMEEAKLLLEAGGGSGSINYTYGTLTVGAATALAPSPEPQLTQAGATSWTTGKPGTLSLVSLNGSVLRSVHQDASSPAVVPTTNLAKGVYLLRFQGENSAPETRKFLLN